MHFPTSTAVLLSSFAITQISAKIPCGPYNSWCGKGSQDALVRNPAVTVPQAFQANTFRPNAKNPNLPLTQTIANGIKSTPSSIPARKTQDDGLEALKKKSEFSILPKAVATEETGDDAKTMHILPVYNNKPGAPARKFDGTQRRPITTCAGTVEQCSRPDYVPANNRYTYARDTKEVKRAGTKELPTSQESPAPVKFDSTKFRNRLPSYRPQIACAGTIEICSRLNGKRSARRLKDPKRKLDSN